MITDLPTKRIFKCYDSGKHFSEFYLQDGDEYQLALSWNKITSLSHYIVAAFVHIDAVVRTQRKIDGRYKALKSVYSTWS